MLLTDAPGQQSELEYLGMPSPEDALLESKRAQLEEKLREVGERLRSELLARGFDPAQQDNLALTGPLAKLYIERENLQAELEILPVIGEGL